MSVIGRTKKVFETLWIHKKKTIFGAGCVGALARYLVNREKNRRIFRGYCQLALQYGNENILAPVMPRRITVLLKDSKARTLFEKHALPLLNLAGLQVDVVLPEDPKQLTTVASVLSRKDADLVYIVGGDDTVSRVLTGLLQPWKENENQQGTTKSRKETRLLPPIGLFFDDSTNKLRDQCENAMAVVRGLVKEANVLQVKVKDTDPVCVLNAVHWGRFADTQQSVPRFWYWGPMKNRFAYFWKAVSGGSLDSAEADVKYVEPCSGCSKCYTAPPVHKSHWLWQMFLGKPRNVKAAPDYSKVINENCGVVRTAQFETVEIIIKNDPESTAPGFDVVYGPSYMDETPFLREGWRRCKRGDSLVPSESNAKAFRAREMEVAFKEKDQENPPSQLVVGGQLMNFGDFSVKVIPKAIQLITSLPVST